MLRWVGSRNQPTSLQQNSDASSYIPTMKSALYHKTEKQRKDQRHTTPNTHPPTKYQKTP